MSDEKKEKAAPEGILEIWVHLFEVGSPNQIGECAVTISATTHVDALRSLIQEKWKNSKLRDRDGTELIVRPHYAGDVLEPNMELSEVPFERNKKGQRQAYVEVPQQPRAAVTHLAGVQLTQKEQMIVRVEYHISSANDVGDEEAQAYLLRSLRCSIHSDTGEILRQELGYLVNRPMPGRHLHPVQTGYNSSGRACVFKVFDEKAAAEHEHKVYLDIHELNLCPFLALPEKVIRVTSPERYALVLPNYGQSVGRWIQSPLPTDMLPSVCMSLGCALFACHTAGYAFVDLKPDHVIPLEGAFVLVDAGSATRFGAPIRATSITSVYALNQSLGKASASFDMVCLASTLYHIILGEEPPQSLNGIQLECRTQQKTGWLRAVEAAAHSDDSWEYLRKLLAQFPQLTGMTGHMEFIATRMNLYLCKHTGLAFDAASIVMLYTLGATCQGALLIPCVVTKIGSSTCVPKLVRAIVNLTTWKANSKVKNHLLGTLSRHTPRNVSGK